MANSGPKYKILSNKDNDVCLCVYDPTADSVGTKKYTGDKWQQWNRIDYPKDSSTASFHNQQKSCFMCPNDSRDGVIIGNDPYKWVLKANGGGYSTIVTTDTDADKKRCIKMAEETGLVKLAREEDNPEPEFLWKIETV